MSTIAIDTHVDGSRATGVARLSPEHADRLASAVENALSENTRRAYASSMRRYRAWLAVHGYADTPWAPEVVSAYLADLQGAPTTVGVARAAILHACSVADAGAYDRLRDHPGLRATMRGLARESRGWERTRARALSREQVRSMVEQCDDSPVGRRDRAVLLLGVSLGLRASDLVAIKANGVVEVDGGLEITVPYSKTSEEAVVLALPEIDGPLCAVAAVRSWLAILAAVEGEHRGRLVRPVRRGGWSVGEGECSPEVVSTLITRLAQAAGLPTGRGGVTSHSMRATFATGALGAGYSEAAVGAVGRWSSMAVLRGYDRTSRWSARMAAGGWLGR